MSFEAMTWASKKKLKNASQKLVLLMLADHSNGHTGQCNPSHKKLAEECCMSISSLKNQIKDLENLGFLSIIHKSQDGVSLPNQYVLNLENNDLLGRSEIDGVGQPLTGGGSNSDGGVGQPLTGGGSNSGYKPVIKPGNNNQEINHSESNTHAHEPEPKSPSTANLNLSDGFTPPTADDVMTYCVGMCLKMPLDEAESFIDHYESVGWMSGNTRIRDWRGKARSWAKRKQVEKQTTPTKKPFVKAGSKDFGNLPDYTLPEKYRAEPNLSDGAIDSTATPLFGGFIEVKND